MSQEIKMALRLRSEKKRAGRRVLARMQPVDLMMAFDVLQDSPEGAGLDDTDWTVPDPNEFGFSRHSDRDPHLGEMVRAIRWPADLLAMLLARLPHLFVCQRWVGSRRAPHWYRAALSRTLGQLTFPVFRTAHLLPLLTLLSDTPQRHYHLLDRYPGYAFYPTNGDGVSSIPLRRADGTPGDA
jgi:hypothetical protein